jgi:hypothetical protein
MFTYGLSWSLGGIGSYNSDAGVVYYANGHAQQHSGLSLVLHRARGQRDGSKLSISVAETLEMCIEISPMLTIEPHVGTDSVNRKLLDSMTSSSSWWPS